ncbi:O-antigen ligase family protein [Pseudomonadota bacterium]
MPITTSAQLSKRLTFFVAFCIAIAIPLRASGVATEQAALGLALLAAIVLAALKPDVRARAFNAITSTQGKIVSAVFLAWAVTVPFSISPMGSLEIGGRTGLFVLAALLIWAVLRDQDDARTFLFKALIVAALGFAVMALLSINGVPLILSALKGQKLASEFPVLAFKAFAAASMCLIPVMAWGGLRLGGRWAWLGFLFTPLALTMIVQTFNRSALAGALMMGLVVVALSVVHNKRAKLMLGAASTLIVSSLGWLYFTEHGAQLIGGTFAPEWLIDPHRQHIWTFAFERFLEHPWVGNGIDQLNRLPGAKEAVPGLASTAAQVPSHPHNWAMEILGETGLIGFLPMLAALTFVAWNLVKHYIHTGSHRALAQIALMAGFWFSALFNFSIWAVWWQLTFLILFAVLAADRATPENKS